MKLIKLILVLNFLWAESSIDVTVDRRRINEGDSINLSVVVKDYNETPNVELPILSDFKIVSGPNQSNSTNVQFVNGKMTKNSIITLSWTLIPVKTGHLEIPALSIDIGGEIIKSKPIRIIVSKRENSNINKISKFFIEAEIDNLSPFRGEQVTLTYILYTQVDITSFDDELPKFKGFWSEEIYSPKNLNLREVNKDGVGYYAATIKKIALFPTKSGIIEIGPMVAVIGIREQQQRWNDFSLFGPPSKKFTISTNSLSVDVQSVPLKVDGEVSSIVGDWKIKSNIDANDFKQDQAVTFEIVVKGIGNLHAVDLTEIAFPNELEVFKPEIHENNNSLGDKIGGEKKFSWVLIPRFAGKIHIPKFDFIFFNPNLKKWDIKSTRDYYLNVSPSEKIQSNSIGLSKEEVVLISEDINFLDESKPRWKNNNIRLFSKTSIMLLILSGIFFMFPTIADYSSKKRGLSHRSRQSRKALKMALDYLDTNSMETEIIQNSIYHAIVIFINGKLGAKQVEYSNEEIITLFKNHGANQVCMDLEKILNVVQLRRFAPENITEDVISHNEIKTILRKADNAWI